MDPENPAADIIKDVPAIVDVPMSTPMAIAITALNMAIKWVDGTVIKDGVMYQQLKMEQRNIPTIDISDLFEVAKQFEMHIIAGSDRIANMLVGAIVDGAKIEALEERTLKLEYPVHPGEFLVELISSFKDELTIEDAARELNITPGDLTDIIAGNAPVTQEIADAVQNFFGYKADLLMRLQQQFDEAAEQNGTDDGKSDSP